MADVPPRETSPAAKSEEKQMFSQANMLGEMGKQVVSARAKDANKLIAWLNFFY